MSSRRAINWMLPVLSLFPVIASDRSSGERIWKNVSYLGGAPRVPVNRLEPDQILILSRDKLVLKTKPEYEWTPEYLRPPEPKLLLEIPRQRIMAVTYSGFRHDMPGAQAAIGIPGKWPKATDHLVIVEYALDDGTEAEVLLRVHKDSYAEIVSALESMLPGK